jgi:hypothetical protein
VRENTSLPEVFSDLPSSSEERPWMLKIPVENVLAPHWRAHLGLALDPAKRGQRGGFDLTQAFLGCFERLDSDRE